MQPKPVPSARTTTTPTTTQRYAEFNAHAFRAMCPSRGSIHSMTGLLYHRTFMTIVPCTRVVCFHANVVLFQHCCQYGPAQHDDDVHARKQARAVLIAIAAQIHQTNKTRRQYHAAVSVCLASYSPFNSCTSYMRIHF